MIKELVDDLHVGPGGHARKHEVSVDMVSLPHLEMFSSLLWSKLTCLPQMFVDCMEEVCAFVKKES